MVGRGHDPGVGRLDLLDDLVKNGGIKMEKVKTIDLPRKPEWLGL